MGLFIIATIGMGVVLMAISTTQKPKTQNTTISTETARANFQALALGYLKKYASALTKAFPDYFILEKNVADIAFLTDFLESEQTYSVAFPKSKPDVISQTTGRQYMHKLSIISENLIFFEKAEFLKVQQFFVDERQKALTIASESEKSRQLYEIAEKELHFRNTHEWKLTHWEIFDFEDTEFEFVVYFRLNGIDWSFLQ